MRYPIMVSVVIASLLLAACSTLLAAEPGPNGEIQVVLEDYDIDPDVIRVKAGQTVRLVIVNRGQHLHELMIGRNVVVHEGLTEGFEEDFFAGIEDIQVEGPGMIMGLPGMEMEMGGMEMPGMGEAGGGMETGGMEMGDQTMTPEAEHAEGEMAMGGEGEAGGGMEMGGMEMGGHAEEGGHGGEAMAGEFGPLTLDNVADEHTGLMVMIDPKMIPPDQATVLTFTVPPDKVGRWELGCFQEQGQHYDDGMRAVLIVEP